MSATAAYPVRVEARLDAQLSRWLWLVKWLLSIPHYLVLAVLWPVFVLMSVVAFVGILVTGRYPRALFEFNVGVLRWSWRVGYYSYSALGTDRYPPFSLADDPSYPARLQVAYPERLSRGLVLIKWWLLALPHYLIIGFFVGGGTYFAWTTGRYDWHVGSGGLIGLLVLIAAVILAITGTYPRGLFDVILGLNRWVLRVAAYAGLMTDRYPPFRLDAGGGDQANPGAIMVGPDGPDGPPGPGTAHRSGWTGGRVTLLVVGFLVALLGVGLLIGGGFAAWASQQRDGDGYLTTASQRFDTDTSALVSSGLDINGAGPHTLWAQGLLGTVRIRGSSADPARPVFLGIGPQDAVSQYLSGVAHAQVTDLSADPFRVTYRQVPGTAASAPTGRDFWVASTSGTGTRALTWTVASGRWAVVVMNADGSGGVHTDLDIGATLPVLGAIATGFLAGGALLTVLGSALIIVIATRAVGTPAREPA